MSEADTHQRLTATVTGRVQGVGFRHFARTRARAHNLAGWVRNEYDGSVRAVAEGPRPALDAFLRDLKDGPPSSRVDHVQVSWGPATGEFGRFSVEF